MSHRAGALLALSALLALAAASPAVVRSQETGEARLRKRVQRFYVLSWLDRHGELWEMFSPDLRARLGEDRAEYVRSARASGFELHGSRVESVTIQGQRAFVDVSLDVRLPGAFDLVTRRHRMVWRSADGDWWYAGSVDATHAGTGGVMPEPAPPEQAPPLATDPGSDVLPPRVPLAERPPPESQPAPATATPRWDLVAIGPGGQPPPESAPVADPPGASPPPAAQAAPAPPATAQVVAAPPAETPPASMDLAVLLPPERIDARPSEATPAGPRGEPTDPAALVRAVTGATALGRERALSRLRRSRSPQVPDAIALALPGAPPAAQAALLDELAWRNASGHADAAAALLGSPEPRVRRSALRAVGALGSASHAAALARRLDAETLDDMRSEAARALGAVGGPDAAAALSRLLADPAVSPELVAAGAAAARACGCGDAWAALRPRLESDGLGSALLAEAAGRVGGADAVPMLERALEDGRVPRLAVLRALVLAGDDGAGLRLARGMLEAGGEATPHDVDLAAASGELPALLLLLEHPAPTVRLRAAEFATRVVGTPTEAADATAALDRALLAEGDGAALLALRDARRRLSVQAAAADP